MQKNEFLLINDMIYKIYSIPNFDLMRSTFLSMLQLLIPNQESGIMMADHSDSSHLVCDPIYLPKSSAGAEQNYKNFEDQDYTRWIMLCGKSMIIRESDLISDAEREKTEFYQKLYKPFHIHYSMQLSLVYNNMFLGVVSLYRSKEAGDFTEDELFLLSSFQEHLNYRFYQYYQSESTPTANYNIHELTKKYHLTEREAEVLLLIFQNYNNEDAADKLHISTHTYKKHIQNLYRKLNISTKWDLLKFKN